MIVPAVVARKHALVQPYVARVGERVRDIVRGFCDRESFAFVARTKEAESLAEKIETGRYVAWSDIDDSFACSIIVPTLQDEQPTLTFLRSQFSEVSVRSRGTTMKDPTVFRFDATRFIGRLAPEGLPDAGAEVLAVSFEIQIRTAFEHAWSVTTHALTYKGDRVDWRRLRLVAQLKAVVEQMDGFIAGFDQLATTISEQNWPEVSAKKSIEDYFRSQLTAGRIPTEAAPQSWTRFCDNLHAVIIGTTRTYIRDSRAMVTRALEGIDRQVAQSASIGFPRSLSLLQFCLGALTAEGIIGGPLNRYVPLLTPELEILYPETAILGTGFNFELVLRR